MNDCRTTRRLARALATVAIATAALGSFAAAAGATFPGENGQLVSHDGGLRVTDPAGRVSTLIHPIGPGPDYDYPTDPEFLPDGERIAYAYDGDIYVSRTDGSERVNLTENEPVSDDPAPSPAGEIAFWRRTFVAAQALFVMEEDGTDVRQITPGEARDENPAWSPDGDRIVFVRTAVGEDGFLEGYPGIYAVDPDGSDLTMLVDPGQLHVSEPTFTPDGDHILFLHGGLVYLMNEDGTNPHRVVDPDAARDLNDVVAAPDGSGLAFSRTFYSNCDKWGCVEEDALITSAADGSEAQKLRRGGYMPAIDWGPAPEGGLPQPDATCDDRDADIVGTPLPDTIAGTDGTDVIATLRGPDSVDAGAGRDVACGGERHQHISGGGGGDLLIPGPGRDRISGNAGSDSVSLRDGRRDRVRCGGGRDVVRADRIDEVTSDCERVRR